MTDPYLLSVWSTASSYHLIHSVATIGVAAFALHSKSSSSSSAAASASSKARDSDRLRSLKVAGYSFLAGNVLFSGSLYAMVLSGYKPLGAITPIGGVAYIVGWLALAYSASASSDSKDAEEHNLKPS